MINIIKWHKCSDVLPEYGKRVMITKAKDLMSTSQINFATRVEISDSFVKDFKFGEDYVNVGMWQVSTDYMPLSPELVTWNDNSMNYTYWAELPWTSIIDYFKYRFISFFDSLR
jgi:hypothetical protein